MNKYYAQWSQEYWDDVHDVPDDDELDAADFMPDEEAVFDEEDEDES